MYVLIHQAFINLSRILNKTLHSFCIETLKRFQKLSKKILLYLKNIRTMLGGTKLSPQTAEIHAQRLVKINLKLLYKQSFHLVAISINFSEYLFVLTSGLMPTVSLMDYMNNNGFCFNIQKVLSGGRLGQRFHWDGKMFEPN